MSSQIRNNTGQHKTVRVGHFVGLFMALAFAFTIHPSTAHAQIVGDLEANIPFEFHAGNSKTLPPGEYRIHMVDNSDLTMMQITSMDGRTSALFQVHEVEMNSQPDKGELIFNKYGDTYFLSELFDQGDPSGSEVIKSKYEKKVSEQGLTAQEHVPTGQQKQQQGD